MLVAVTNTGIDSVGAGKRLYTYLEKDLTEAQLDKILNWTVANSPKLLRINVCGADIDMKNELTGEGNAQNFFVFLLY